MPHRDLNSVPWEIHFSFYKRNPFKKIFQISSKKKKLRNFLTKLKFDFFFNFFFKRCLYHSSVGTKNNEKKLLSSFREIWEILEKIFEKKVVVDFGEIFWKKEHSDFFPRIFQKMCRNIYLREMKQLRKIMK